jgi:hypothetical protein
MNEDSHFPVDEVLSQQPSGQTIFTSNRSSSCTAVADAVMAQKLQPIREKILTIIYEGPFR